MTIKTYIRQLQKLAEKHPKAVVVFAVDNEGNSLFEEVRVKECHFNPSVGSFSGDTFLPDDNTEEFKSLGGKIAVCLN